MPACPGPARPTRPSWPRPAPPPWRRAGSPRRWGWSAGPSGSSASTASRSTPRSSAARADATARLTVGKRLTPDLNVLYSQDLRGTEERILALEYTLSDRFSLLLTRTDPGTAKTGVEKGWAFDLRIRQSR